MTGLTFSMSIYICIRAVEGNDWLDIFNVNIYLYLSAPILFLKIENDNIRLKVFMLII
jgi:hypothetical protein